MQSRILLHGGIIAPQYQPLKRGTPYAMAAGLFVGFHEHAHFSWTLFDQGGRYSLDPWILMILSGAVHYPRSTPALWPRLLAESKRAGLATIGTYVFWDTAFSMFPPLLLTHPEVARNILLYRFSFPCC